MCTEIGAFLHRRHTARCFGTARPRTSLRNSERIQTMYQWLDTILLHFPSEQILDCMRIAPLQGKRHHLTRQRSRRLELS